MKYILLFAFIITTIVANAQISEVKPEMRDQYQIDYTRHCLKKYHDEKITSYVFSMGGLAFLTSGFVIEPNRKNGNNLKNGFLVTGGLSAAIGLIVLIDSEKWLKRAYVGPDGFGVKFNF